MGLKIQNKKKGEKEEGTGKLLVTTNVRVRAAIIIVRSVCLVFLFARSFLPFPGAVEVCVVRALHGTCSNFLGGSDKG